MLVLNHTVPAALILPERVENLKTHLEEQGAHWLSAQRSNLHQTEAGAVTGLKSLTSDITAERTRANKDHSQLNENGLNFQEATHCGFMVEEMEIDPNCWSCALRFHAAGGSARTLMTMNPQGTDNYIFLQQTMGQMIFKDQQSSAELTAETGPAQKSQLVLAGMCKRRFWLRAENKAILQSEPTDLALDGPLSLFIGCRNNKGRLQKTLGSFQLLDMVVWPGINILESNHQTTREALDDAYLWRPAP